MYYDFYLYTNEIADFDKAFELTEMVIDSVDPDQLISYNFNRYNHEGEDHRLHITVRLNLENADQVTNITEKLGEMRRDGHINDFTDDNPLVPPLRGYSINHKLAHEASTKSAFKFYNKKNRTPNEFQTFTNNANGFLSEFIPLWLKSSGFIFNGVNDVANSNSILINELVGECSTIVGEVDRRQISDITIFSGRLIHLFLNCIGIARALEIQILDNLARRFEYRNRQEFLNDLRLG